MLTKTADCYFSAFSSFLDCFPHPSPPQRNLSGCAETSVYKQQHQLNKNFECLKLVDNEWCWVKIQLKIKGSRLKKIAWVSFETDRVIEHLVRFEEYTSLRDK